MAAFRPNRRRPRTPRPWTLTWASDRRELLDWQAVIDTFFLRVDLPSPSGLADRGLHVHEIFVRDVEPRIRILPWHGHGRGLRAATAEAKQLLERGFYESALPADNGQRMSTTLRSGLFNEDDDFVIFAALLRAALEPDSLVKLGDGWRNNLPTPPRFAVSDEVWAQVYSELETALVARHGAKAPLPWRR